MTDATNNHHSTAQATRLPLLDYLRAGAIIYMVFYHFLYDLALLRLVPLHFYQNLPVTILARGTLILFLFCVGFSLALGHAKAIRWPAFNKRLLKISLGAAAISFATYLTYPTSWVYFGILHCIAVASLIGLAFLRVPAIINMIIGAALFYAYYGHGVAMLPKLYPPTMDYISLVPWFGGVLWGIAAYQLKWLSTLQAMLKLPEIKAIKWLSEQSFWIYLIHQPLLFGALSIVKFFIKS